MIITAGIRKSQSTITAKTIHPIAIIDKTTTFLFFMDILLPSNMQLLALDMQNKNY